MTRLQDLRRLYELLDDLEKVNGGKRNLEDLGPARSWPSRGVYFFFEPGEMRSTTGTGPRLVRVGTHAISANSASTLHGRLLQHRGNNSGGGHHRGSVFRLLIGSALLSRGDYPTCTSWGLKGKKKKAAEQSNSTMNEFSTLELPIEAAVSRYLRLLPFVYLPIDDEPGRLSLRAIIERNTIALLSNFHSEVVDPASPSWLGEFSHSEKVRKSGLWNQQHVTRSYDTKFLALLDGAISNL